MILQYPLFKADVAEYRFLLLAVSAHNYFLDHPTVENIAPGPIPQPFFRNL